MSATARQKDRGKDTCFHSVEPQCRSNLTLDAYLRAFSGPKKYPAWTRTIESMLFGVELEFIIHHQDRPDRLLRRNDVNRLVHALRSAGGFDSSLTPKNPLYYTLGLETRQGYIAVKPDFAFHILEVSLPPRSDLRESADLIHSTLESIDRSLASVGLQRSEQSVVQDPNIPFDLVPNPRLAGYLEQFPLRADQSSSFYFPHYPALIAAAQIHVNVPVQDLIPLLPALYQLEWLAIHLFSQSRQFDSREVGCARVLMYEDSLGPDYKIKTIPSKIPETIEEYVRLFNNSPGYFREDPFFPVRDLTFIRPRPYGTTEFRSTCSQGSVDKVLELQAFRALQVQYGLLYGKEERSRLHLKGNEALNSLLRHSIARRERPEWNSFERDVYQRALSVIDQLSPALASILERKFELQGSSE